jgi:filamentous hemagglutinin family protein
MRRLSAPPAVLHRRPLVLVLALLGAVPFVQAAPEGGVVKAGQATISGGGAYTRIDQGSTRAIIDWRSFSIATGERVQFVQASSSAATLNRVTGGQLSALLGRMDANGQVFLINPNGIVVGKGAEINVGGLIASTANISDRNFIAGSLVFDEAGNPGAGVTNAGTITAAEGGLVALVAPYVRNDGLIHARLGRVILGSADIFSVDLYGDGLISLAMVGPLSRQLFDERGQPVKSLITQAGEIDTAGGKTVLVTADTARNVLDSVINMSGTIKADAAVQEDGRILLLGKGGSVEVSGSLSAYFTPS